MYDLFVRKSRRLFGCLFDAPDRESILGLAVALESAIIIEKVGLSVLSSVLLIQLFNLRRISAFSVVLPGGEYIDPTWKEVVALYLTVIIVAICSGEWCIELACIIGVLAIMAVPYPLGLFAISGREYVIVYPMLETCLFMRVMEKWLAWQFNSWRAMMSMSCRIMYWHRFSDHVLFDICAPLMLMCMILRELSVLFAIGSPICPRRVERITAVAWPVVADDRRHSGNA